MRELIEVTSQKASSAMGRVFWFILSQKWALSHCKGLSDGATRSYLCLKNVFCRCCIGSALNEIRTEAGKLIRSSTILGRTHRKSQSDLDQSSGHGSGRVCNLDMLKNRNGRIH